MLPSHWPQWILIPIALGLIVLTIGIGLVLEPVARLIAPQVEPTPTLMRLPYAAPLSDGCVCHVSTEEMIAGTGGYDYGEPVANSIHTQFGVDCVNCHMASTPGWVDDGEGGEGLPGHDEVGAHTFNMTSGDGVENIAACTDCHADLENFNRTAAGDYDGDGSVEGIQDEVQGLLDVLLEAIQASGVEWLDHDPYWENVTTEAQKAAIYNWSFVSHDNSLGIHNTARSVQLLQRSYKDLTGQDVPGANLR